MMKPTGEGENAEHTRDFPSILPEQRPEQFRNRPISDFWSSRLVSTHE